MGVLSKPSVTGKQERYGDISESEGGWQSPMAALGNLSQKPLFIYNSRLYIFHLTSEERFKSQRNADGRLFVSTLHFSFPAC